MLTEKIAATLNDQMAKEAFASNSYLSMASWCDGQGLRGCAEFFYAQSNEEREHMLKLVKYINESGSHAHIPSIKEPLCKYESIKEVFELSLEQEKDVSQSINKLVELALGDKDYATNNFLQWFVAEQHEEEQLFRSILDIIRLAGFEGKNLLIIDNEVSKIRNRAE